VSQHRPPGLLSSFSFFDTPAGLPPYLKMRLSGIATAVISFASAAICVETGNLATPLSSRVLLPSNFKPPQVFKNVNLVHIVDLEKGFPRETINVVIENTSKEPQDEYFIPFTSEQMEKVGVLEVRDKKDADAGIFDVQAVEYDTQRYYQTPVSIHSAGTKLIDC
jgi:oligosaccharyltransferase complex subunit alpha (ribophorin I)